MAKTTFFKVLKSNLKCAVCEEKDCPVRYYPEREMIQHIGGRQHSISCKKDRVDYIEKSLKRPLP